MKSKFVPLNHLILTKVAKEIPKSKINSAQTKKIIKTMLKMAYGQQKDKKKPVMVGLAAPQLGISKRIILVDVKADGKGGVSGPPVGGLKVYLNPEITWTSKKEWEWYEGCYSTGKVCGIVKRPVSIKIKANTLSSPDLIGGSMNNAVNWIPAYAGMTVKWTVVEQKYRGYVARIFQHEIDHLNGKRFPDLIKNPDKLHWVLKKEFPIYRDKKAWKNWPKKCSFERWQRLKNSLLKIA